jgi:hypothetical protein
MLDLRGSAAGSTVVEVVGPDPASGKATACSRPASCRHAPAPATRRRPAPRSPPPRARGEEGREENGGEGREGGRSAWRRGGREERGARRPRCHME